MKNLIRLLISVIVVTTATESFAQSFGVKASLNLSNMLVKWDGETESDDFKMKPGFHIGATAEFPLSEMISFETGLLFSTKGYRVSEKESGQGWSEEYKKKLNLLYLDIPLNAKASIDLGNMKAYGTFGPYLGMGLSGKYKYEGTYNGETQTSERDIKWGSDEVESDLKRLDFGLTIGAGVKINSIQIGLSYNLGLANVSPYTDVITANNRVLGLSIGYQFGGK